MCTCILGYAHTHTKHSLEIISHNASAGVSVGERRKCCKRNVEEYRDRDTERKTEKKRNTERDNDREGERQRNSQKYKEKDGEDKRDEDVSPKKARFREMEVAGKARAGDHTIVGCVL